jgi:hypothetical protein
MKGAATVRERFASRQTHSLTLAAPFEGTLRKP